jgi:glycine/D-amino acid oxidase-like deaminating enzyme
LGGIYKPYGGNLWASRVVFKLVEEAVKLKNEINKIVNMKGEAIELVSLNIQTATEVLSLNSIEPTDLLLYTTKIEKWHENLIAVNTDKGTIYAKKVLHATNAWARNLLPQICDLIIPVRNQVIMTTPMRHMWKFGLSANYGYDYFMQRPDGRILLGGMRDISPTKEENSTNEEDFNNDISLRMRSYLALHFQDLQNVEVEREWIGILGFTPDRNPLVGPLMGEAYKNQYIACGYSGHGMPLAFLVGKQIINLMIGSQTEFDFKNNDDVNQIPALFLPSRYNV